MQKINNIQNKDGLENAPMLSKLQDQNNISIPDGYFDALENDIMAQINPSAAIVPKRSIGIKSVLYYVAAASVIAVLSLIAIRMNDNKPNEDIIVVEDTIDNKITPEVKNIVNNSTTEKVEESNKIDNVNLNIETQESKEVESLAVENNNVELPVQNSQEINKKTPINNINNDYFQEEEIIADNNISGGNGNNHIQNPSLSNGASIGNSQQSQSEIIVSTARLAPQEGNLYLSKDTCINNEFTIDIPNDTISVVWNDNSNNKIYRITKSGKYWAEYYYKGEKICTDTINVNIVAYPEINIADVEVCNHQSVLLNSGLNENTYKHNWSISNSSSSEIFIDKLESGQQMLSLKVSSCCDTVTSIIVLNVQDCNIKIPNIITPNGDGYNDAFVIKGLENYPKTSVNIFNRNGKLVYQSSDYRNDWKAENVASGNYFYSIIINDGKHTEKGGVLKIMR